MAEALRDVYGKSLAVHAAANEKVVVLDADLSNCSKTCLAKDALNGRMFNVGIAEANMIAMGAGFASCGFIPFVNTFATLAASMCSLAMKALIGYSHLNVRLVGVNNGLCGGYDGATHHAIDDINIMRAVPGLLIASPSDAVMTDWMVKELCSDRIGPAYISISRNGCESIYAGGETFEFGRAKRLSFGHDAAIFAWGLSVRRALDAAELLKAEGIGVSVYDMFTIKPLDRRAVLEAAAETGAIVTVDEHSVIGGLGSAVLEVIAEEGLALPVKRVGIQDCYTESGRYNELIKRFGLDAGSIAQAARDVIERKHANG